MQTILLFSGCFLLNFLSIKMRSGSLSLFQPIPSPSQSFPFSYHTKQLFLLIIPANSNYQQHAPPATLITAISRTLRNWLKRFTLLHGLQRKTNSFSFLCVYLLLLFSFFREGGSYHFLILKWAKRGQMKKQGLTA